MPAEAACPASRGNHFPFLVLMGRIKLRPGKQHKAVQLT
jgi:hypothetical protein